MSFRRFTNRTRKDQDLAEEIDSHLAHAQDANSARGLSSEEARRQAYVRFGNSRSTRERVWRYRSFPWLEDRGLVSSQWGVSENNRKAKFYRLTGKGRKELNAATGRWRRMTRAIGLILGESHE